MFEPWSLWGLALLSFQLDPVCERAGVVLKLRDQPLGACEQQVVAEEARMATSRPEIVVRRAAETPGARVWMLAVCCRETALKRP